MTDKTITPSLSDFTQNQILWDRDEILQTIERDENYQEQVTRENEEDEDEEEEEEEDEEEEEEDEDDDDDEEEEEEEEEEDREDYEEDTLNERLDAVNRPTFDDATSELGADDILPPHSHDANRHLDFLLSSSPTCSSRQSNASEIRLASPGNNRLNNRKRRPEAEETSPDNDDVTPVSPLPRRASRPTLISRTPEETNEQQVLASESEEYQDLFLDDVADETSETDNDDEDERRQNVGDDLQQQREGDEEEDEDEEHDEDEEGDDDVGSQAAEFKQRRNEALLEFSGIEKRFADLRTQMFYERMLALKREAELIEAGKHAELMSRQREIKRNLETRKCIANAWLEYTREAHKRQLEMVKYQTKYTFEARKSELRCMLIDDRQRMKHQLKREKRLLDSTAFSFTAADHLAALRIRKQEQGKVAEMIQLQLAHGFPAAVLPELSQSDINEDLVAIGVLKPQVVSSAHHKPQKRARKDKHGYFT